MALEVPCALGTLGTLTYCPAGLACPEAKGNEAAGGIGLEQATRSK